MYVDKLEDRGVKKLCDTQQSDMLSWSDSTCQTSNTQSTTQLLSWLSVNISEVSVTDVAPSDLFSVFQKNTFSVDSLSLKANLSLTPCLICNVLYIHFVM